VVRIHMGTCIVSGIPEENTIVHYWSCHFYIYLIVTT
jgi:hypothetical protein